MSTSDAVFIGDAATCPVSEVITDGCGALNLDERLAGCETVFLKPNLVSDVPEYIGKGCNTSIAVIESIVQYLSNFEGLKIVLGESDTGTKVKGRRLDRTLSLMGVYDLARHYGFEVVNLTHDDKVVVNFPEGLAVRQMEMGRTLMESDLIINLPKIKTHKYATITCAMKNMFGVIPDPLRVKYHRHLHQILVDLNWLFEDRMFVVMDGLIGMQGLGPLWGESVKMDLLVLSHSSYLADLAAIRIMGLEVTQVDHLRLYHKHFDSRTLDSVKLLGDPIEEHLYSFRLPKPNLFIRLEGKLKHYALTRSIMFNPWVQRHITYRFRHIIRRLRGGAYSWYLDS